MGRSIVMALWGEILNYCCDRLSIKTATTVERSVRGGGKTEAG